MSPFAFSHRTAWPPGSNVIAEAIERRRASRLPFVDLTETNPTVVGLTGLDGVLLASPEVREYRPEPLGLLSAREAVSAYHGGRVPSEHICLTASTSEAYSWLFKLLCEPGDEVLVPTPSYPLFEMLARIESVRLVPYPTRAWDDWSIDFERLEAGVTGRTRAIVVVSPNNPTGAVLHRGDAEQLRGLCGRRGLALICDEVFADYAEPRADRLSTLAGTEDALTFVLSGLSKVCLAPQLKVGWIAASGPADLLAEAWRRIELIADTYLSVNTPAQLSLPALLDRRSALQRDMRERLRRNRSALLAALGNTAATVLPEDGGWSAVVRLPVDRAEEAWVIGLLDRGVLVHPGFFYDFDEQPIIVLSLIVAHEMFDQGLAVVRAALQGTPA